MGLSNRQPPPTTLPAAAGVLRRHIEPYLRCGLFISYRREDSSGHAGRLYDHIVAHFAADNTFFDVNSSEPGSVYRDRIRHVISSSHVVLAVIGPNWLAVTTPEGERRLDEPTDIVRFELENALRGPPAVIPVLVNEARIPRRDELPQSLRFLVELDAIEIDDRRWTADVAALLEAVDRRLRHVRGDRFQRLCASGDPEKAAIGAVGLGVLQSEAGDRRAERSFESIIQRAKTAGNPSLIWTGRAAAYFLAELLEEQGDRKGSNRALDAYADLVITEEMSGGTTESLYRSMLKVVPGTKAINRSILRRLLESDRRRKEKEWREERKSRRPA